LDYKVLNTFTKYRRNHLGAQKGDIKDTCYTRAFRFST